MALNNHAPRAAVSILAAAACLAVDVLAATPTYPSRPIRLIIPFAAGGGSDAVARILAPKLSESMGTNWIVDNRSGAAGNIASELVVRAAPDGHTVLLGFSSVLTANPIIYKLPFQVERDLQPLTLLATGDHIVVAHPSVPAKTVPELVALARQSPRSINFASAGAASSNHVAAEMLMKGARIDMVHVPYKGGGPAVAAVVAGESQILFASIPSAISFIKAGRLRALATTGLKRSSMTPDLPTVSESGYPGFEAIAWYALFVPGATPKPISERIRSEALKAMQHSDVQTTMSRQGLDPTTSTPAELSARIKTESAISAAILAGTKPE